MLDIAAEENAVLLPVKVVPGASRTRYLGQWDGRAKFAVSAPPERGKANKALTAHIAKLLGVRKTDVAVVSGPTSAVKTIRIERVTVEQAQKALQPARS